MNCPLCAGVVRTAEREYHVFETADDGIEHLWACDRCHWVQKNRQYMGHFDGAMRLSSKEPPSPTHLGDYTHAKLTAAMGSGDVPEEQVIWLKKILESLHWQERDIREAVGNTGPRERPAVERAFEAWCVARGD